MNLWSIEVLTHLKIVWDQEVHMRFGDCDGSDGSYGTFGIRSYIEPCWKTRGVEIFQVELSVRE